MSPAAAPSSVLGMGWKVARLCGSGPPTVGPSPEPWHSAPGFRESRGEGLGREGGGERMGGGGGRGGGGGSARRWCCSCCCSSEC